MFNFDSYIDAMNTQIKNVFKQDYNDELNNYIIETVRSYVNWAYEAYKINHTDEETTLMCQFIAEYIFAKLIEIINTRIIDHNLWEAMLQQIGYVIYDVVSSTNQIQKENIEIYAQIDILNLISHSVFVEYSSCIKKLPLSKQEKNQIIQNAKIFKFEHIFINIQTHDSNIIKKTAWQNFLQIFKSFFKCWPALLFFIISLCILSLIEHIFKIEILQRAESILLLVITGITTIWAHNCIELYVKASTYSIILKKHSL